MGLFFFKKKLIDIYILRKKKNFLLNMYFWNIVSLLVLLVSDLVKVIVTVSNGRKGNKSRGQKDGPLSSGL